jgi:hypothetical protein
MEFEMVENLLKNLIFNAVLVFIALVCLLPAHINENVFYVLILNPIIAMRHYPSYNI